METRNVGSLSLPVIGMGTWKTFGVRGELEERRCADVVATAVDHGIRIYDTSPMYGESERVLAGAVKPMRERVIIADKVWALSPSEGRKQVERALAWYGTVDIYQVHNLVAWEAQLPLLEDLRARGSVRIVGATHYQHSALPDLMRLMETRRIQLVQIPYNAADRFAERDVLPLAEELGIGVLVMEPLGSGALLRYEPKELSWLERFGVYTWAQALLKWIVSDPRVHAVLPATSNPRHARENAAAGAPPWFDEETRSRVAHVFRVAGARI